MARRSNKTAHVLNLLAGHDSQNSTEETTANETAPSPSGAAPAEEAAQPSAKEDAKPDAAQPTKTEPEPVTVNAPVSAQNISVIDTTGTDPVAELIQQELSNQFESELAAVSPNAAADSTVETDTQDAKPHITEPEEVTETAPTAETLDDTQTAPAAETLDDTQTAPTTETLDDTQTAVAAETLDDTEAKETVTTDFTSVETESAETTENDTAEADAEATDASSINSENADASETVAADSPEESQTVTADSAAVSQQEPTVVSVPEAEAVPEADTLPEQEQAATFAPETEAVPEQEQAEVSVPEANTVPEPEPDFVYLNVMEEIVKDKIIYFMRQFDLCTCERCKADTIALTMNGLMPKYIVTTPAAVAPLISYYTNRLIPDVTVEAIKACMTVKDNPRH